MRYEKRYVALPSPLTAVMFWRICLDEAQMVESTTAKVWCKLLTPKISLVILLTVCHTLFL